MSLSRIASRLSPSLGRDPHHLQAVAMSVLRLIEQTTVVTGRFRISGFGTFHVTERAQRPARNPRTGAPAVVCQRTVLRFRQERSAEAVDAVDDAGGDCAAGKDARPRRIRRTATAGMRSELGRVCAKVAAHFSLPPEDVLHLILLVLDQVQTFARLEGRCTLRGFGTFHHGFSRPRMARNPATGDPVPVPARAQLTFRHGADRALALDHLGAAFFSPRPVKLPSSSQVGPGFGSGVDADVVSRAEQGMVQVGP